MHHSFHFRHVAFRHSAWQLKLRALHFSLSAVSKASFPTGHGRLLIEVSDGNTDRNITFTTEQAMAQHPQFHITPEFGWMNDPNGMFQLGALYHVFFQYNPAAGTAVSL